MNFKRPAPDSEFDSKLILDFSVSGTDKFPLPKGMYFSQFGYRSPK